MTKRKFKFIKAIKRLFRTVAKSGTTFNRCKESPLKLESYASLTQLLGFHRPMAPFFKKVTIENTKGFTLAELLVTLAIIGILAAFVGPQLVFANNPLEDGTNQVSGIFKQSRARAMVTTSILRVMPVSATQLSVQNARARVCAANTQLQSPALSTDTVLKVVSVAGFAVGDQVTVGSSSISNVIATNPSTNQITLGQPLGSSQPVNTNVNLSIKWANDSSFSNNDLTLPQSVYFTPTNWILCFDSRGLATQYNNSGSIVNQDLNLTLKNSGGKPSTVQVLQGGAVQ